MTKTIYNYHSQTGEFLSASEADASPLEPGVFLVPQFATDVSPPQIGDNQVCVFAQGVWSIKVDWRGHHYWLADGSSHTIVEIGTAPPDGALETAPAPTVEQLSVLLVGQLQDALDAFAQTRNYDNMLSACTYASSTVAKFKSEGQACVNLRDATWAAAYALLEDVRAGRRPVPNGLADIQADLPALEWPQ